MTKQTKTFIEISDIISFRCECKGCGVSLTLPIEKNVGKSILKCPSCGNGWTRLENSTNEILVNEFADKTQKLANLMDILGFRLTLEIKNEESEN